MGIKRTVLSKLARIIPLPKRKVSPILMYHRIIDPETYPMAIEPGMYVTPQTFESHIAYLTAHYEIVSIEQYSQYYRDNTFQKKCIVLTFDDGWIDFYQNAYPILKKYHVPACVFLPTSFIGTNKYMWTEEVAILKSTYDSLKRVEKTFYDSALEKKSATKINLSDPLSEIIAHVKKLDPTSRKNYITLATQIFEKHLCAIPLPLFMNWDQITEIREHSLVTFGSHSHSHFISTEIDPDLLRKDIQTSLSILRMQQIPHNHIFCYPNQSRSQETDKILESLDFSYSLGKLHTEESSRKCRPICIERTGIHEDISYNQDLFALRLLGY